MRCRTLTRFRLSTVLWTVTLLAVACGWLIERHRLRAKAEMEISQATSLGSNLGAATFINKIYGDFDNENTEEFERRRRVTLLSVICHLSLTEEFGEEGQKNASLMHADNSLSLLNCSDLDQVRQMARDAGLASGDKSPFLDPEHEDYGKLADFITRVYDRRRRQPTWPARIWLEAVKKGDQEKLRTAFSKKVQKRLDTEGWDKCLETYQDAFLTELGDYEVDEFAFGYSTALDRDGQVEVFHKGKEFRKLQIIKKNDRWKIDKP